jgi:hypothetical protein
MEWWKFGIMGIKADDVPVLISDKPHLVRIDSIPPNPVFQHSIIPLPHDSRLRHG